MTPQGLVLLMFIPDSDFLCLMSAYVSGFVTCVYTCKFSSLTVRAREGRNFLELAVEELCLVFHQ